MTVTPCLFDRAYISPYDKDLQVFTNITQDPRLSTSIKDLVYDTSTVQELIYERYFEKI